ncbi:hypothetical protein [Brevundimonas sp. NIBR11]|uniref:hypothetical protein n=1 Tax=Brevundimonas sp. NIBR11 TaxID=3015999 RepID=UPI0022F05B05|nr:hypothetical protein [Brevundimonas sp. NIBR11]WGM31034.1 hypothetical protein KKHFBJBL_01270 [Brevundimonas sp. NIBR11]
MRDIRNDFYEPRNLGEPGARLVVACAAADCERAALMDPRPLFGARRFWPVSGRSERFRCACGSRETRISYTANTAQKDGPISMDAIRLWL